MLHQQFSILQPSSAVSERVFSLLSETFGKRQNNSLEDYVESCIMIIVNVFYVGIFGHNIWHNRTKIAAVLKSIIGQNPPVPNVY